MSRKRQRERRGSVQDALEIQSIGDGYVLRSDGIAVGIGEISSPDLRLHDEGSLSLLLQAYESVLRSSGDRCMLYTYAVPPDLRPLLDTLQRSQQRAQDLTSYMVLTTISSYLEGSLRYLSAVPTVRWIIATPSEAPEEPPMGTWGELYPASIVGKITRLPGDPVQEALGRLRRLINGLAALGTEPQPRILSAAEIRTLLAMSFDPIAFQAHPLILSDAMVRPLHVSSASRPSTMTPMTHPEAPNERRAEDTPEGDAPLAPDSFRAGQAPDEPGISSRHSFSAHRRSPPRPPWNAMPTTEHAP